MAAPDDIAGIKEKLTAERAKLLESFANLPRETMLRPFGEGGWSIKDLIAHVAMAESVNVKFAKMMITKDSPLQLKEFAAEYPDFPGEFELDKFNAWIPENARGLFLGAVATAQGIGLAVGPSLGGALWERVGVYAPFETAAVFLGLAVLMTLWDARNVKRLSETSRA